MANPIRYFDAQYLNTRLPKTNGHSLENTRTTEIYPHPSAPQCRTSSPLILPTARPPNTRKSADCGFNAYKLQLRLMSNTHRPQSPPSRQFGFICFVRWQTQYDTLTHNTSIPDYQKRMDTALKIPAPPKSIRTHPHLNAGQAHL